MTFNTLFLLYAALLVTLRAVLTIWPLRSPTIGGFRTHHWMFGLALIAAYPLFHWSVLLPVGTALFVDELPLLFIYKSWKWPEDAGKRYRSPASVWGVVAISVVGYLSIYFL